MRKYLLLSVVLFISIESNAQTTVDSIKSVVNTLFASMATSDGVLLRSVFTDSAILQTIVTDKSGNVRVKTESVNKFAESLSTQEKGNLDERIVFDMIKTDGDLASVWTPYQFYYKGKFSHCGVNSFQLIRMNNTWKIHYLIDTRRKLNCN